MDSHIDSTDAGLAQGMTAQMPFCAEAVTPGSWQTNPRRDPADAFGRDRCPGLPHPGIRLLHGGSDYPKHS